MSGDREKVDKGFVSFPEKTPSKNVIQGTLDFEELIKKIGFYQR